MFVKTFPVGPFQCNCTILGDEESGDAIVIDPGDESDKIMTELTREALTVKYLLHTHAHIDHIGSTRLLKDKTSGKIALHREDQFLYDNIAMQGQLLGLKVDPVVRPVDHYLVDQDEIVWGGHRRIGVVHTPGHTPGSLTFLIRDFRSDKDLLLTGDTLFMGSIGRTDLWGGDYKLIMESIKTKLLKYNDETVVIPGHGPHTTIGHERGSNPFITQAT